MSAVKNGGLIANCRARSILTLVLIDIPSGDPALVASGPTIRPGGSVLRVAGYPELASIASELVPGTTVGPAFDEPIETGVAAHVELARAHGTIITGGELPSRVQGPGRGGRNTEFVLRLARELADWPGRWRIASFATDGSDGASDSAGGWIEAANLRGIDVEPWLARSDSATLLAERGTLFPPMATACNLMDLRIVARDL